MYPFSHSNKSGNVKVNNNFDLMGKKDFRGQSVNRFTIDENTLFTDVEEIKSPCLTNRSILFIKRFYFSKKRG